MASFRFFGLMLAVSTTSAGAATLTLPANDTYLDSSKRDRGRGVLQKQMA